MQLEIPLRDGRVTIRRPRRWAPVRTLMPYQTLESTTASLEFLADWKQFAHCSKAVFTRSAPSISFYLLQRNLLALVSDAWAAGCFPEPCWPQPQNIWPIKKEIRWNNCAPAQDFPARWKM